MQKRGEMPFCFILIKMKWAVRKGQPIFYYERSNTLK